jgi:hypothetical protein
VNAIETAVCTKLLALAPGVGVYLHEAPQEDAAKLIVFWVTGREDVTGTAPLATQEIRVSCYAQVHADCEALANTITTGLKWWQYGAPGLRLGPLTLANKDADWESEFGQYRVSLVWAAQAVEWSV